MLSFRYPLFSFLNVKIYFLIFRVNKRFSCVLPAILLRFEHMGAIETQQRERGLLSISYFASNLFFYQCISFIDVPEFRPFLITHFNTEQKQRRTLTSPVNKYNPIAP